jgi:hypothetical protein
MPSAVKSAVICRSARPSRRMVGIGEPAIVDRVEEAACAASRNDSAEDRSCRRNLALPLGGDQPRKVVVGRPTVKSTVTPRAIRSGSTILTIESRQPP